MSTRDRDEDHVSAGTGGRADHLIDRVAQEMTRGEPSARLRSAVRERIATDRRSPFGRFGSRWAVPLWIRAASVAAAVLILGIAAGRTLWMSQPPPLISRQVTRAPLPPPVVTPPENALSPAPSATGQERPVVRQRPKAPVRFEPLTIEPLEVRQIAVETSSGMMPIEIMELQIEPLRIE